jgi:hypothetical protein
VASNGKAALQARLALQAVESATKAAIQVQEALADLQAVAARVRDSLAILEATVHHVFVDAHPPICPKCSGGMSVRQNRETGGWFWGCVAYPKCRGTRDPMKWRDEAVAILRAAVADEEA